MIYLIISVFVLYWFLIAIALSIAPYGYERSNGSHLGEPESHISSNGMGEQFNDNGLIQDGMGEQFNDNGLIQE